MRYALLALACFANMPVLAQDAAIVQHPNISIVPSIMWNNWDEGPIPSVSTHVEFCDDGWTIVLVAGKKMCAPAWMLKEPK